MDLTAVAFLSLYVKCVVADLIVPGIETANALSQRLDSTTPEVEVIQALPAVVSGELELLGPGKWLM